MLINLMNLLSVRTLTLITSLCMVGHAPLFAIVNTIFTDITGGTAAATLTTRGYRFEYLGPAGSVTSLGAYDLDSGGWSTGTVRVGLWSDVGALLGMVSVDHDTNDGTSAAMGAGGTAGLYKFENLVTSVALVANSFYRVGAALGDIPILNSYIFDARQYKGGAF